MSDKDMLEIDSRDAMTDDDRSDWQPGIGHNSCNIPPEELEAELAALREAEEETGANDAARPEMIAYLYEVRFYLGGQVLSGELEAYDLKHARRKLRVILCTPHLPADTRIYEKGPIDEERRKELALRNRRLLRQLTAHHRWLQGDDEGVRADLSDEDLTQVNLEGRDLSHVRLNNAKLSGARLRGAKLVGADLTGADLNGANLTNSDLSNASLTEANLIEADLSKADLQGADLWRANLARCVISPDALHQALNCDAPGPAAIAEAGKAAADNRG
ncbi:MAG: pentapeptide repeat-containing protein [Alphaproteobacteria bacterium]|nr:pentapeptide repeat-containing protein [Alphaproteobacteria bacterium]